ncbi:MAG TPA: hypothetical protein DCZ91_20305 [Lachnospiraceae bacterium]|nr:hypothetical protein [Lachnospiraceae bacterium]
MGKKRNFSGYTKNTPEHLLLDAGAFFKNFIYEPGGTDNDTFDSAVAAGKLIGATQGGGEFSAVPSIRQVEVDGVKGRAKGLEVIDSWDVYLKATILETTAETVKAALSAATVDTESDEEYDIITGNAAIELEDYIDNVTWIGTLSGSNKPVIIQVFNALNTDGLKLTVKDKGEATIPVTFYGHYSPEELDSPPFDIFYPKKENTETA